MTIRSLRADARNLAAPAKPITRRYTAVYLGVGLLLVKGQLLSRTKRVLAYFKGLVLGRSFTTYQPEPGTEREFPFAVAIALGGLLACVLPL